MNQQQKQRTACPSDWAQMLILMRRNLQNDMQSRRKWMARIALCPIMWMLYTLGFLLSEVDNAEDFTITDAGIRVYEPAAIVVPKTVYFGASTNVTTMLDFEFFEGGTAMRTIDATDALQFQMECENNIGGSSPADATCVFMDTDTQYNILYGGNVDTSPTNRALAGTQYLIQNAIKVAMGQDPIDIQQFQRLPKVELSATSSNLPTFVKIFPGIMLILAAALLTQFVLAPVATEKFKDIQRSFIMVGVKPRVYLQQWILYFSLQAIVTAVWLTIVSFAYDMFAESSWFLVFLSHWLGLIHVICMAMFYTQICNQEELLQGLPWLTAFITGAIGVGIILAHDQLSPLLYVLSLFSPFAGMLQYTAIYSEYDRYGLDLGITFGDDFGKSGLAVNLLVQILGIIGYNLALTYLGREKIMKKNDIADGDPAQEQPADKFEPLALDSEVLLEVKGLHHTFPKRCCGKGESIEVLKGLDLQVCRGEVFGYLGHNSSGKTTSIGILSGEIPLQEGSVSYNFRGGVATVSSKEDLAMIRKRIGICPQHNDILHSNISCREFLRLFAKLKGRVPIADDQSEEEAIEHEVQRRLDEIQFTSSEDADKPIETYSGGMKRKVCIALAFLCDPEVVFLDEPSAGIDPYNRRQVWDMIVAAKEGRSIILTTHFLDEADVLSDRVGILKNGQLISCGSTLFLKHQIGGYNLRYVAKTPFDVTAHIPDAVAIDIETQNRFEWSLQHGSEEHFPPALRALRDHGATNVLLELTSLEHVFLETGKEDDSGTGNDDPENIESEEISIQQMKQIWEKRGTKTPLSACGKLFLVTHFMFTNAWAIKGTIFLNIIQPLIYVLVAMLVISNIESGDGDLVIPDPLPIANYLLGEETRLFFLPEAQLYVNSVVSPVEVVDIADFSDNDFFRDYDTPFLGGYWDTNGTLQYNPDLNGFSLQIGLQILTGMNATSFSATVTQLPYVRDEFRTDELLLPMMLAFGFSGIVFAVLDVLLLKADNIVALFRVSGITEWHAYTGVILYKFATSFVPFFLLVIVLGIALESVLFGNGGRWLATILVLLCYAYSTMPMGLLIAKRFITKDFRSAANSFPGIYMSLVSIPYLAWSIAFQSAPGARPALRVLGDILCVFPPVAFQRGIGAVVMVSTIADDPDISWTGVWNIEGRIWFVSAAMIVVGSIEWFILHKLTTERPPTTKLPEDEKTAAMPDDNRSNFGVSAEMDRSNVDDTGINARCLVKVFPIKADKMSTSQKTIFKRAVKGVSFGIKHNQCLAVVGPNGAGKSVTMGMLSGEHTPEYGSIALDLKKLSPEDSSFVRLFHGGYVAFCPQFDALFPKKTVRDHLHFYAQVRGLNLEEEATSEHIEAIVRLLGLQNHLDKLSTDISGGYKRRTCLAISMIGYPSVMMVDECTTGMDPGARHLVWRVLRPKGSDGVILPAILLSTHYMDEASVLGDRIAFFIDGQILSVGSLTELKTEFCNSYFVEIALQPDSKDTGADAVVTEFVNHGMEAEVYESLPRRFKLKIPFNSADHLEQLASIFEILQDNRQKLGIQFFAVQQMNLEQIFIDMSRRQFEAEEALLQNRNVSSRFMEI